MFAFQGRITSSVVRLAKKSNQCFQVCAVHIWQIAGVRKRIRKKIKPGPFFWHIRRILCCCVGD